MASIAASTAQSEERVPIWTRFETRFESAATYTNPVQEIRVDAEFVSPSARRHAVEAFWDGARIWRLRFSPDELGEWTFTTRCRDAGLGGQRGRFLCVRYHGSNPLYRHGALRVSKNRRYLEHADGTPFFWMGDTAWNGLIKSSPQEWEWYLNDRAAKGFTVIQTIATHWNAGAADSRGRTAYTGIERISIDPAFFADTDLRQNAINAHGLISSTILAHDSGRNGPSPGMRLPDAQVLVLVRYLIARYGAHQVAWSLAGDRLYRYPGDDRWKRIGRAVFGEHPVRLATVHAGPKVWAAEDFRGEPWYSFNGYQSGHWDGEVYLRWLCEGPPAQDWRKEPGLPSINLEPNYEGYQSGTSGKPFTDAEVRRAAYWSLLVAPTAGVGYGAHGLWSWQASAAAAANHPEAGVARPWTEALGFPGSTGMKHAKSLFTSIPWWRLAPAQELLAEQPGDQDVRHFAAMAQTSDRALALCYIPLGDAVTVRTSALDHPREAHWYNPRSGKWAARVPVRGYRQTFQPPDDGDWVLVIGSVK